MTKNLRLLLVDGDPKVLKMLEGCLDAEETHLVAAHDLAEGRAILKQQAFDLVLIETQQPDGCGLELVEELTAAKTPTPVMVLSHRPEADHAIDAFRRGACDFLLKPVCPDELVVRLNQVLENVDADRRRQNRTRKLKRTCRDLTVARDQIADQVNVLCNDLVLAYEELTEQVQQMLHASEFTAAIRHELDLEHMVRKVLEYVLDKAGPTNAAIFLPSGAHEFSLGGYVNYDCDSAPSEVLLQELADQLVPRVIEHDGAIHLTHDDAVLEFLGEDCPFMGGRHLLAINCNHQDEPLAVVVLFREAHDPFDESIIEILTAIAPILGDSLARIIRIHHRTIPFEDDQYNQAA